MIYWVLENKFVLQCRSTEHKLAQTQEHKNINWRTKQDEPWVKSESSLGSIWSCLNYLLNYM